jgi:enamine deaminase RidA (YjgF/YER057c/UK114 family)
MEGLIAGTRAGLAGLFTPKFRTDKQGNTHKYVPMNATSIIRINPQPQWSDAVIHNGIAYFVEVPESGSDIAGQAQALLTQAQRTLALVGSDKSHLLMATIYLKRMADRDALNAAWQAWLPEGCAPARVCVSAEMSSPDYLLEIAFTAAVLAS